MAGKQGAIQRKFIYRLLEKFKVGDDCWEWEGSLNDSGYGQIYDNQRKQPIKAHRAVYEWLEGPIPAGLCIDHLCKNRRCVKPSHLDIVTRSENSKRNIIYQRTVRSVRDGSAIRD